MRSSRLAAALLAAVLGCGAAGALRAQEAAAERPSRETVEAELAKLRDDPRFGGVKQTKTWRFKTAEDEKKPKPRSPLPDWLTWIVEFFRWVTAVGRVFVWALGALLVALLLVGLRYWIRERDRALPQRAAALPSHVRDLDIRPESLPDRIGAAAAALWQRGEQRAALSLLYRGALSRLVHVHAVPIRAASTEGESLALARARLRPAPAEFVSRLIGAWQLAVYGARLPETPAVLALCEEFDAQLAASTPATGGAA